jgi:hypothetical protein
MSTRAYKSGVAGFGFCQIPVLGFSRKVLEKSSLNCSRIIDDEGASNPHSSSVTVALKTKKAHEFSFPNDLQPSSYSPLFPSFSLNFFHTHVSLPLPTTETYFFFFVDPFF